MGLAFLLILTILTPPQPPDSFAAAAVQGAGGPETLQGTAAPAAPKPEGETRLTSRETQLTSRRTGVTCTMRIVRAGASMDAGILGNRPQGSPKLDSIVRHDLSPCVE